MEIAPVAVVDLARAGVSAMAPEEMPLFDQVSRAWQEGRLNHRRPPGGTARIGVPAGLDITVILDILTGTLTTVLGEVAYARLQARRWPGRRRRPQAQVTIEPAQRAALHATLIRNAQAAGIGKAKARLLADSVFGPPADDNP